jgi:hypothetical protein
MPARLLLDAHLPLALPEMLKNRGIDTLAIQEWRAGVFLKRPDDEILFAAMEDDRILVTRDVGTIPETLKEFARLNLDHAGVICISSKTFVSGALRPVVDAIEALLTDMADLDWRNRMLFLPHTEDRY